MTALVPKTKSTGSSSVGLSAADDQHEVLDNQLKVRTPENIAFQYQLAGPFRRFNAYVIDILISQIALYIIGALLAMVISLVILPLLGNRGGGAAIGQTLLGLYGFGILLTAFLSTWFYGAVCETYFNGQTPGKMMLRMRVLSENGIAIDGAQATLRNFFRLFDLFPMVSLAMVFGPAAEIFPFPLPTAVFGLISMTISRKYQRIGDLVAGTIVVNEEKKWTHGLAKFEDERVPRLAELIPSSFVVSATLARALSDFVDRRRFLPYQRVAEIAAHLGTPLIEEFNLPPDTNHDLLLCSLYYKTFIDQQIDDDDIPTGLLEPAVAAAQPIYPVVSTGGETTQ